jgi:hypothetical protein
VYQHFFMSFEVLLGGAKFSGIGLQNGIEGMEGVTQLRVPNPMLTAIPLRMPCGLRQSPAARTASCN